MCTFYWLTFRLGAMRTLPTKFMISSLTHTPCANVVILPLETFSAVGSFLLDIVSLALASSGELVLLCLCLCCCSSNVITLLSALGMSLLLRYLECPVSSLRQKVARSGSSDTRWLYYSCSCRLLTFAVYAFFLFCVTCPLSA